MIKRFVLFTVSLTVLFFIVGCPQVKTSPAESSNVESPKVESPKVESPKAEARPTVHFHDNCADILASCVNSEGMVNYKELKRRKFELKRLLDKFDDLDRKEYNAWPQEDKIAFWINAYNLQMLKIIVDNYPIESSRFYRLFWPPNSIRHIRGIWTDHKFMVMDEEFTLSEIEKRFFRQQFDEPRIFFALSQASISSPPLRNEPYCGDMLDQQLDDQTRKFLTCPHGFRIDRDTKTVYLSAMLQSTWFGDRFLPKYDTDKKFKDQQPPVRAVLNFITNYVPDSNVSFLEVENYTVAYLKYDWTLNEGI
jgi:hypothetical protein